MKRILALVMAMLMVVALCACGSKTEEPAAETPAPEAAPAAEAPAAPAAPAVEAPAGDASGEPGDASGEPGASGEPAAPAVAVNGDDFVAWCDYVKEYAVAGAPSAEEGESVAAAIDACSTVEEVEAISQLTVLFENVGVLRYDEWLAAGKPAADAAGIGTEADNFAATGEPTGEPAN